MIVYRSSPKIAPDSYHSEYDPHEDELRAAIADILTQVPSTKHGLSPSICPVELTPQAWKCVGFLPIIPENQVCDFNEAPQVHAQQPPKPAAPKPLLVMRAVNHTSSRKFKDHAVGWILGAGFFALFACLVNQVLK